VHRLGLFGLLPGSQAVADLQELEPAVGGGPLHRHVCLRNSGQLLVRGWHPAAGVHLAGPGHLRAVAAGVSGDCDFRFRHFLPGTPPPTLWQLLDIVIFSQVPPPLGQQFLNIHPLSHIKFGGDPLLWLTLPEWIWA